MTDATGKQAGTTMKASAPSTAKTAGEPILRVEDLSVWIRGARSEVQVLDRVSFAVRAGERWGIAGESGAGKSMTMNAITALLPGKSARISGKILYRLEDGTWQDLLQIPYRNRHEFVSRHVAVIFQDSINALNPNERVERQWAETVFLHKGRLAAGECRAHLLRQMDVFSIRGGDETLRKFPHQLSGGMRQRIAIAMALESDAHIIIADEPTTSLDTITQRATVNYLDDICRRSGGTLLYISHNLGILQAICDHIMVMKDGRVVEQGLADDVFFRGQDPYTRTIVGETLKIMGRGQA